MRVDRSKKVEDFLLEVRNLCKKHGLSISHEDGHGSFVIVEYADWGDKWISAAIDGTDEETDIEL